ncbi:unnamed protein product, partial [Meganyctiphanes norvegica]
MSCDLNQQKIHLLDEACNSKCKFEHISDSPSLSKVNEKNLMHVKQTPGKLYNCSHCANTFSNNNDLIIHLKIHHGDKPYQCSDCDKAFSNNNELAKHLRIHSHNIQNTQLNNSSKYSNILC